MKTRVSYISITFTGGDYSQSSDSISAITISENAECKIQGTTNGGQLTIDPETMHLITTLQGYVLRQNEK